ncbi:MAG: TM1802 family CRISPR-associated protein [Pseudomonadota bacterium]
MINTMRELALIELNQRFGSKDIKKMSELRQHHAAKILPLLVEDTGKVQRVYILSPTKDQIQMKSYDVGSETAQPKYLPFVKPSGSQSAAIGPLLKRTYKPKDNPPYGPSPKIIKFTLKEFQKQAKTTSPWQAYFQDITSTLLNAKELYFNGTSYPITKNSTLLETAVAAIDEKETVFLTVQDTQGLLPGQRQEYLDYLNQELANLKYLTTATPAHKNSTCPLCEKPNTTIYPNAIKGAGINIGNADRPSAFSGMDKKIAWKNYALCLDCADLLYIFKNHILSKFISRIAGENALLLPNLLGTAVNKLEFMEEWHKYLLQTRKKGLKKNVEPELMEEFFKAQDDAHLTIQIIWATFGQVIDDVNGYITDILPSRLHQLSELNAKTKKWQHALFPHYSMDEAAFDLQMNMLWHLFKRPGAKKANESKQLREIRQQLAAKIYHAEPLNDIHLWNEIMTTARYYLVDVLKRSDAYGLCHEGYSHKKNKTYWTLAGWIRHLARFIYYLEQTGVLPMTKKSTRTYEPQMEKLQQLFAQGAGINSDEKAFAFLVGILYGKLLQVQSAKKVNVISSTLPWLKRLQLAGKDLPELYTKICHKFMIYGGSSQETRQLITETAKVGKIVGNDIELDTTKTCYFLLLGQALTVDVLPSKKAEKEDKK